MYVMAQDQKSICDCRTFRASKNIGGKKEERYVLIGQGFDQEILLGFFPSEEAVIAELHRVLAAIEQGAAVYTISL